MSQSGVTIGCMRNAEKTPKVPFSAVSKEVAK